MTCELFTSSPYNQVENILLFGEDDNTCMYNEQKQQHKSRAQNTCDCQHFSCTDEAVQLMFSHERNVSNHTWLNNLIQKYETVN